MLWKHDSDEAPQHLLKLSTQLCSQRAARTPVPSDDNEPLLTRYYSWPSLCFSSHEGRYLDGLQYNSNVYIWVSGDSQPTNSEMRRSSQFLSGCLNSETCASTGRPDSAPLSMSQCELMRIVLRSIWVSPLMAWEAGGRSWIVMSEQWLIIIYRNRCSNGS